MLNVLSHKVSMNFLRQKLITHFSILRALLGYWNDKWSNIRTRLPFGSFNFCRFTMKTYVNTRTTKHVNLTYSLKVASFPKNLHKVCHLPKFGWLLFIYESGTFNIYSSSSYIFIDSGSVSHWLRLLCLIVDGFCVQPAGRNFWNIYTKFSCTDVFWSKNESYWKFFLNLFEKCERK